MRSRRPHRRRFAPVDSTLWAAAIAGAIAATALVANVRMTRLTLAHQRDRSYEDRHWQAVADLYIDILLQEKDYGETISRTMSVNEGTVDGQHQRDRVEAWRLLHARVDVFASDAVRDLFLAWRGVKRTYGTQPQFLTTGVATEWWISPASRLAT